jgi:hypothetical protein
MSAEMTATSMSELAPNDRYRGRLGLPERFFSTSENPNFAEPVMRACTVVGSTPYADAKEF